MARVLVAGLVALIISILAGPTFIDFLRRHAFGQHIREDGPQHHSAKQGTPTMGGLLIVVAAAIAFLATSDYTLPALTILGATVACGAIGFIEEIDAIAGALLHPLPEKGEPSRSYVKVAYVVAGGPSSGFLCAASSATSAFG